MALPPRLVQRRSERDAAVSGNHARARRALQWRSGSRRTAKP